MWPLIFAFSHSRRFKQQVTDAKACWRTAPSCTAASTDSHPGLLVGRSDPMQHTLCVYDHVCGPAPAVQLRCAGYEPHSTVTCSTPWLGCPPARQTRGRRARARAGGAAAAAPMRCPGSGQPGMPDRAGPARLPGTVSRPPATCSCNRVTRARYDSVLLGMPLCCEH